MIYMPMSVILTIFAVASAGGVGLTLLDKKRAKKGRMRISELWLFLLGLAGGATAMYITMWITHHKIRYLKFKVGFPVIMALHAAFLVLAALYGPEYFITLTIWIEYLIAALAAINIFAAAVTNWDKKNAQKGMWRVPEAWLMFLGAIGGAFAMLLTMCVIRHKTRYLKFMLGLPLMLLAQIALLIWVFSDYCQFILVVTF